MQFLGILSQAGVLALLSLIVTILPLAAGIAYAVRPTEARLALMRPISLAGMFAGLSGFLAGVMSTLRAVWTADTPVPFRLIAVGLSESIVPLFVAFGCLTVAWLCAALGLRRHA
jgi:ABC-type uncharacterized transport system permease subunit